MQRLIEADPRNGVVIFPYIGGEEVNTSPTHAHHRYVINFADFPLRREELGKTAGRMPTTSGAANGCGEGIVPLDYPEPVAEDWPELLTIVEERVKPETDVSCPGIRHWYESGAQIWWQLSARRTNQHLYESITGHRAGVGGQLRVGQPPTWFICILAGRNRIQRATRLMSSLLTTTLPFVPSSPVPHEIWARFFGSSMKDDLRYTPF